MAEHITTLDSLAAMLGRFRFNFTSERDLQNGVALVLEQAQIPFKREVGLTVHDRPDFLLDDGLAIEVKIKGSLGELLRQAMRYLGHDEISGLLVIGTPHWLTRVPPSLLGKPIHSLRLVGSLL